MFEPSELSDADLREELVSLGAVVGPITESTRSVYEKQLQKRRLEFSSSSLTTRSQKKERSASKSSTTSYSKDISKQKRRTSSQRSAHSRKGMRSESEYESDDASANSDIPKDSSNDADMSYKDSSSFATENSCISSPSRIPKNAQTVVYPGLLNRSAPILTPSPKSMKQAKAEYKSPTPPRSTFIRTTTRVMPSYSPWEKLTIQNNPNLSARRRLNLTDSSDYSSGYEARVLGERSDDSDDDDHMESSRIIRERNHKNNISQKLIPSNSFWRYFTELRTVFKRLTKFTSKPTSTISTSRINDQRIRKETYISRLTPSGSDVSRILLLSLTFLFGFLILAYLTTVHAGTLMQCGKVTLNALKDTSLFFYTYAVLPVLTLSLVIGVALGIYFIRKYHLKRQAEEKRVIFDLIERTTDIIRDANEQGSQFVAEPHVRDMLIPPSKRMRDSNEWRRWQEVVKFINLNESRVSTETRIINGVECAVWKWISAKKAGWQGNAFDGTMRLKIPEEAPSNCLKLRGMFPTFNEMDSMNGNIAEAVLQKVAPIKPLHVHVEKDSKEGIVFARFATLADCKEAFKLLHGTWFNSQLVSAKFLRNERYDQRFPDAFAYL